jgi:type II secretory pathway predicted ATPase ExeA
LNSILQKPVHEALRQRVTIHYNFECLSQDETEKYVLHKLESAGASGIIGDGVLKAAHGYARGIPRMIDNLMTDALTLGAQQNKHVIDTETLLAAMNNLQLD